MESVHNPDVFMGNLRQVLSQGKKRLGLLVGAGAPMSLKVDENGDLVADGGNSLIPGVDSLTQTVTGGLSGTNATAVSAITAGLGAKANIETILSKVRLLQQAVGTTLVNGLDEVGYEQLAATLCHSIGDVVKVQLPKGRSPFTELVSWIGGTRRDHAIEIFTTNYDLLFEEAFERAHAPFFDGFSGGGAPFFDPVSVASDDLPPRWSRLWKLHGSLGWENQAGSIVRTGSRNANELVYPDHLKYDLTQKQPYSALFERLRQFLLTPDSLLLVSGFSFRDAHVSAVLDEALSMNANSAAIAFQHEPLSEATHAFSLATNRPNLSVYASDGAVIGGVEGKWRPGELPKNWGDIRATFWGQRHDVEGQVFLLGDFAHMTRFCALAQSNDLNTEVKDELPPQAEDAAPTNVRLAQ